MPRSADSRQLHLHELFRRLQSAMLSDLHTSRMVEHASTSGADAELHWLDLFRAYLPSRFRATPAFILNSSGRRSRQIDIAIYDHHAAPPLFPHSSAPHLPIESVCAVFEVKPAFSKQWLRDAAEKIESVRELNPPSFRASKRPPLLAGLLASTSVWTPKSFPKNLRAALADLPARARPTIGCALDHGSFDATAKPLSLSSPDHALAHFTLRLLHHLNQLPPTQPTDFLAYL